MNFHEKYLWCSMENIAELKGGGGGIDVTTAILNFELIAIHCGLIQDNLIFKLP